MKGPVDDRGSEGWHPDDDRYETDIGERKPSEAVVDVTSAMIDREPSSLTPLYRTIDPDALDDLCANADPQARANIRFDYEGLVVIVSPPDTVSVFEP